MPIFMKGTTTLNQILSSYVCYKSYIMFVFDMLSFLLFGSLPDNVNAADSLND